MAEQSKQELAARLVACKHWRWMDGMLALDGDRVNFTGKLGPAPWDGDDVGDLPDLDDPATLGCVLALVREAWGNNSLCSSARALGSWTVCSWSMRPSWSLCSTEAEALVAALEAAP